MKMKKVLLTTFALATLTVSFTSCRKNYICDCTQIPVVDYGKLKKGSLAYVLDEAACASLTSVSDSTCKFTTK
jgi:hypothetical protein